MVNSRLGCFAAAPCGAPLIAKYGARLPSSLTRVLSRALVSSTRLPVSVCGTVGATLARGFSRHRSHLVRVRCYPSASPRPTCMRRTDLPIRPGWPRTRTTSPGLKCLRRVPPSLVTRGTGHGISTVQPSLTPYGFSLGPTNLRRTNLPEEPLGFRRTGFSPVFSLLIPAFSLPSGPRLLPVPLHS